MKYTEFFAQIRSRTKDVAIVAGVQTKSPGIWSSKDAVTRLQELGELAGKI